MPRVNNTVLNTEKHVEDRSHIKWYQNKIKYKSYHWVN